MWLFGALAGKSGYIIAFLLIALVAAVFLLPQIRQSVLKLRSQQVTIARTPGQAGNGGDSVVSLDIITVLGKDGIPSIDNPASLGRARPTSRCSPSRGSWAFRSTATTGPIR